MSYILKNDNEFERLEQQSTLPSYDYKRELENFNPRKKGKILDAACGSGVVSRYLATKYPHSQVMGCDVGEENLEKAVEKAKDIENLSFEYQDITQLEYKDQSFDHIICRYALQHVAKGKRDLALKEFYRCLKQEGTLTVIDFDGTLHNLYPRSGFLDEALKKIEEEEIIDLRIGRKLPFMFTQALFTEVRHKIECLSFSVNGLKEEVDQLKVRIQHAMPFFEKTFGSLERARQFSKEFLTTFDNQGITYFYNKFVVHGKKTGSLKLVQNPIH